MSIRNKRSAGDGNDSDEAVTAIEQSIIDFKAGKELPFIPSGIKELDYIFKGFGNSELVTIGARTGVGKTALVTGIGLNMARKGVRVGIVSLEMDGQSMMKRLTQQYCGVDIDYLMANDDLTAEDELLFVNSMRAVKALPMSLICPKNMQVSNIKNICRRMSHSDSVDIIFVDYLQKMQAKAHSREGEIAVASEAMRLMAKELGIPIVQLVQLNRTAEDNTPTLAHIRESGSAEQDSQKVLLIDRARSNEDIQDCAIIVAKNRSGRVGRAEISFHGAACQFTSKVRIVEADVPRP
jgi:replicative DNA helicase